MDYPQKRVIAFLLCLVVVIAVFSSHAPYSPQQFSYPKTTSAPKNDVAEETPEHAIARYNYWLTWVTFILAVATVGLGGVGIFQIRIARAEFIATHRPKITIHAAELRRDVSRVPGRQGEEYFLGASLLGFNRGESVAKNIEVRGQIFAGSNFAIDVQRPIVKTFSQVSSGIKLRAQIKSDIPIADALMGRRTGIDYYCLGWIAYWDENGQRRETGFCFRADLWGPAGERWVSAGKAEYEYEY
jgi:hypothetical protein